jgi:hypothetical protein
MLVQAGIPLSTNERFEGLNETTGGVIAFYTFKENTRSIATTK